MTSHPRTLGLLTAAGTLPYLCLKAIWLFGGTAGVRDAAVLADPSITALNGVTVVMDLMVVALALALTHGFGSRLPAWLVLLPLWVGTGFLVPMALVILPATAAGTFVPDPGDPLEPWVQPMVYGGFAWQGIGLTLAFAWYAARRWGGTVTTASAVVPALVPLLRVITAGGTLMAALSAALHLVTGFTGGSVVSALVETANAGFAVAAVVGVRLLAGATAQRWLAVALAWVGTGAMFAWGLWTVALTTAGTAMAAPDPVTGPAALTGLLGGFALAVAGLLALTGTSTEVTQRAATSHTSEPV